jgi:hypothetical protein
MSLTSPARPGTSGGRPRSAPLPRGNTEGPLLSARNKVRRLTPATVRLPALFYLGVPRTLRSMRPSRYSTQDARKHALALRLATDANTIEQLRIGMEIEHEHDDLIKGDPGASATIAAAHIREDPLYYLPLAALENFRDGSPQGSKFRVGVHQTEEGFTVVMHLLGHDEPLWGHAFSNPDEAHGLASFLSGEPAMGIVYAWMILSRHP